MKKSLYYFSSGPRERVLKRILSYGWQVQTLFLTSLDKTPKLAKTIEIAEKYNLPIKFLDKKDLQNLYPQLDPKLVCFSLGFKYLFSDSFINHFNLMLNVHGTLLPYYAGARTINWIIENGENFSGVTVHKIDKGMDTGPILLQERFAISPFDTGKSLYRKTLEFEPQVVEKCLKKIENKNLTFFEQPKSKVLQYPNRIPEHSHLDIKQPLESLINKIKAADHENYPAYFFYNGKKIGIKLFRIEKPKVEKCLKKIENKNLTFFEQPKSKVLQYPNRIPEHSHLDIKQPLESLINKIKAADHENYPAYFFYNGKKIGIKLFRIEKPKNASDLI